MAMLVAVEEGSFNGVTPAERERLLRVLACVRKEEDAVPDRLIGGFADVQREIHATTFELANLLQTFRAWRLRHQVPMMWTDHGVTRENH